MRARTRHPRLVDAACTVYGLALWMYPVELRRACARELVVTFRNRAEDVLDSGGLRDWLAFAVHMVIDWMRAYAMLLTEPEGPGSASLLGLSEGDVACGCIDRTTVDMPLVFAVAGLVVACAGWYWYFAVLPLALR